jgi:tetratricopeptide (TPR) repeat protein
MDFNAALQAASKALDIDPNFHKALVNKGNAHFGMKEYHKALECFQKG